jgi:hypothetical protein
LFKIIVEIAVVPQQQRLMAGQKKKKLEAESQKHILRFLRDDGGCDHKTFFNKSPAIFGAADLEHRGHCEKYFHDTKRRVHSDPVKFKAALRKYNMAPAKKKKQLPKRHDSDGSDDSDDSDDDVEEIERGDEPIAFVGLPNPRSKQPSQQKTAKKKATGNERNGELSDEF